MPGVKKPGDLGDRPIPQHGQGGFGQSSNVGEKSPLEHTKPSTSGPQQGSVQQRGNIDSQNNRGVQQRGVDQQGSDQKNEPVEMPKVRPDIDRR